MGKVVRTYLHISDIHIGIPDTDTGDARTRRHWAQHSIFDGLLGHDYKTLVRLARFRVDLERHGGAVEVITTGDLTTCGAAHEFELACGFLGDRVVLRPPIRVGLRDSGWATRAVSGNHDRWSGRPFPLGGPTKEFERRFPSWRRAAIQPREHLGAGRHLRFVLVDSDHDVGAFSSKRMRARGCFQRALDKLDKTLEECPDDEIRVLLLHHSLAFSRRNDGANLSMTRSSRQALEEFVWKKGIDVILSGHTHAPTLDEMVIDLGAGRETSVLEACCGTTSQRTVLPLAWRPTVGPRRPSPLQQNTLFVHRLVREDDGRLMWRAEAFGRGRREFKPGPVFPQGRKLLCERQVWPR